MDDGFLTRNSARAAVTGWLLIGASVLLYFTNLLALAPSLRGYSGSFDPDREAGIGWMYLVGAVLFVTGGILALKVYNAGGQGKRTAKGALICLCVVMCLAPFGVFILFGVERAG